MTSEGLGEMFVGDSREMCGRKLCVCVCADTSLAMLEMWRRNSIGPITFHCSTPDITGERSESLQSAATACFLVEGSRNLPCQIPILPNTFAVLQLVQENTSLHLVKGFPEVKVYTFYL